MRNCRTKPIQQTRVVLVADGVYGRLLIRMLDELDLHQVSVVPHIEEARRLCQQGAADACLLVVHNFVADELSARNLERLAPGCDSGVPSLLLADVVTPYVAQAARRSGYLSAVPITNTPRLLYRRISALLQKSRRARVHSDAGASHSPQRIDIDMLRYATEHGGPKPTLH